MVAYRTVVAVYQPRVHDKLSDHEPPRCEAAPRGGPAAPLSLMKRGPKNGRSHPSGGSRNRTQRKTLPNKLVAAVFLAVFALLAWATSRIYTRAPESTDGIGHPPAVSGSTGISPAELARYHAVEARERV